MYKAICSIYESVKAKVRTGGDLTPSFLCPRGVKQGENLSPVLFSLFIEELANDIRTHGKHGIQLVPDIVEVLILLFADDVILASDTVQGLQNQLNVLYNTAHNLGLVINLEKSNIVVFRNGGHLSLNEKWYYGTDRFKIVNSYKYLGIYFSTRLSYSYALRDLAKKAKAGLIRILKLLRSLNEKSPIIFFKIFDTQIQPILNYGAEVWGMRADLSIIEKIHVFGIKRFLNVSVHTPNKLVYSETGRYNLSVNVYAKTVSYWLRIQEMAPDRLPFKSYKMLLFMHEQNRNSWASFVCFFITQTWFFACLAKWRSR